MKTKIISSTVYCILALAIIGFLYRIVFQPSLLLRDLLIAAIIVGLMFFVVRLWSMPMNKEQRAFIKAARQSRKRLRKQGKSAKSTHRSQRAIRPRSTVKLTVIEGKKGKKPGRIAR